MSFNPKYPADNGSARFSAKSALRAGTGMGMISPGNAPFI
jgi:hypothetical protein